MSLSAAVDEYLRQEKAAMRTPEGADHKAIAASVAKEFDLVLEVLVTAVIDHTVQGGAG